MVCWWQPCDLAAQRDEVMEGLLSLTGLGVTQPALGTQLRETKAGGCSKQLLCQSTWDGGFTLGPWS